MTDHELLESIYAELQEVKLHTRNLELSLENETNRNIRIIAEGHLELDNALKVENEKELLLIRVNSLENEVRKIKQQLESA